MSEANVESARRAIEAFNGGDIEAAFESTHPEIEWEVAREHPNATTHRGRDAVAAYFNEWQRMLEDMRLDIDRIVDAGDAVVTIGRVRGVGIGSGVAVEVPIGFVSILRDGKTIRVEEYLNPAEALQAAGITE